MRMPRKPDTACVSTLVPKPRVASVCSFACTAVALALVPAFGIERQDGWEWPQLRSSRRQLPSGAHALLHTILVASTNHYPNKTTIPCLVG